MTSQSILNAAKHPEFDWKTIASGRFLKLIFWLENCCTNRPLKWSGQVWRMKMHCGKGAVESTEQLASSDDCLFDSKLRSLLRPSCRGFQRYLLPGQKLLKGGEIDKRTTGWLGLTPTNKMSQKRDTYLYFTCFPCFLLYRQKTAPKKKLITGQVDATDRTAPEQSNWQNKWRTHAHVSQNRTSQRSLTSKKKQFNEPIRRRWSANNAAAWCRGVPTVLQLPFSEPSKGLTVPIPMPFKTSEGTIKSVPAKEVSCLSPVKAICTIGYSLHKKQEGECHTLGWW